MTTATVSDEKDRGENLGGVIRGFVEKLIGYLLTNRPNLLFGVVRNTVPILLFKEKNTVVVTRYRDVLEILTSRFFLGQDDTTIDSNDNDKVQAVMRREDLSGVAKATAILVNEAVEKQFEKQEIEVVSMISRWVPARLLQSYFGYSGRDIETLIKWSKAIQHDILPYLNADPETQREIQQASAEVGVEIDEYAKELIEYHYRESKDNPDRDDFLSRLLKARYPESISKEGEKLVAGILRVLVNRIESSNMAIVNALDEILSRPHIHEEAIEAAREDNNQLLFKFCCEALRFNPVNPFVIRTAKENYKVAAGTWRSKTITANSIVLASAFSAMHDGRDVPAPDEFCIDRPANQYFLPGFGLHNCLGDQVAEKEVVEIIKRLLVLPNLRAASEINYHYGFNPKNISPFPESYYITFEPNYRS